MLLKDKHVFVVEDDPLNLAVISTILRSNGAVISFDTWGTTTFDTIINKKNIDLIILDLMLPRGHSGYDIFDALQKEPDLADVPVVIVSASDPDVEMEKARQKGISGFISKPIDRKKFPRQMAAILAGEQVWGNDDF